MKNNEDYKSIPGWGMDADLENEPTYPMKNYTGDDHNRISYERSEQQPQDMEILMSTERPAITRVFGTSVPPSGLSGNIRRYAFQQQCLAAAIGPDQGDASGARFAFGVRHERLLRD